MMNKKIATFLIGLLVSFGAHAAEVAIGQDAFTSAIPTHVPATTQGAVNTAIATVGPTVSVDEMIAICDAGFKDTTKRLEYSVKFVDAVLGAQQQYLTKVAECNAKKGTYTGGKCVGRDGYELVYANVCPSGSVCVNDFAEIVTNMQIAMSTHIAGYQTEKGITLTCLDNYRDGGTAHYLQCSAGGQPYEFAFAKLNATAEEIAAAENDKDDSDQGGGDEKESAVGTPCPATGNGLKSITDATKVGDSCKSSIITSGTVFMRKNNTCSCRAETCVADYQVKSGKCVKAEGANVTFNEDSSVPVEKNPVNLKFFAVCGDDAGKTGGTEICVKDVFTNKVIGGTQVPMTSAIALAQEYARVKQKDDSVQCFNKTRDCGVGNNDDCVKCTSATSNTYYEFIFDDVRETNDRLIQKGVRSGLCKIFGKEYSNRSGGYCEDVSASICRTIGESASRFGYSTSHTSDRDCKFVQDVAKKGGKLRVVGGLDNYKFYDYQINPQTPDFKLLLEAYALRNIQKQLTSFKCNDNFTEYASPRDSDDDLLTCYINGQPMDFVVDDASESWRMTAQAGYSGWTCIGSDGTYVNRKCAGVNQQSCSDMDAFMKRNDPRSSGTRWTGDRCVLRDANEQYAFDKTIEVGGKVVMWTAASVAGGPVTWALVATDIVATGVEMGTSAAISKWSEDFAVESRKCNNSTCADSILRKYIYKITNGEYKFDNATKASVKDEMNRLTGLLSENTWNSIFDNASANGLLPGNNDMRNAQLDVLVANAVRDGVINENAEIDEASTQALLDYYFRKFYTEGNPDLGKMLINYYGTTDGRGLIVANKTAKVVSVVSEILMAATAMTRQICTRITCFPKGTTQKPIAQKMVKAGIFRKSDVIRSINAHGRPYDIIRGNLISNGYQILGDARPLWKGAINYGFNNTIWSLVGF